MSTTNETQELNKNFTQGNSGVNAIDLEGPAKTFIFTATPLLALIPRMTVGKGTEASWKAFLSYNADDVSAGLVEGARGNIINHETKQYFASYKALGLTKGFTDEALLATDTYEDVAARTVDSILTSVKQQEELTDLAGNNSVNLGKASGVVLSTAQTGGSLSASTAYAVKVVALGQRAFAKYYKKAIASVEIKATQTVVDGATLQATQRSNNVGKISDAVSITTGTGSTNSITATVSPIAGAYGYAWFLNDSLVAITSFAGVSIKAEGVNTATLVASFANDNSKDDLVWDGLYTQVVKADSNAYVNALSGELTIDGDSIPQIDVALEHFYSEHNLSPDYMIVDPKTFSAINKLFAGKFVINTGVSGVQGFSAGNTVKYYLNKMTGKNVEFIVHSNAIAGSILFYTKSLPFANSGVSSNVVKRLRRDYHQYSYPMISRSHDFGVYVDGVLQVYAPFSLGLIYNIAV